MYHEEIRDHVLQRFEYKKEWNKILIKLARRVKEKDLAKPEATLK